jgi:predicted RNase H-like nuclease
VKIRIAGIDLAWGERKPDGVCALIGYRHWLHDGARTEVLGYLATGFILIPRL